MPIGFGRENELPWKIEIIQTIRPKEIIHAKVQEETSNNRSNTIEIANDLRDTRRDNDGLAAG